MSLAFAYIFIFFLLLDNWYFPKVLTLPQLFITYCIQISDILRLNNWSGNGSQRTSSHPINFKLNSYFNSHTRHRVKVAQLCPTLCEPMNCMIHGLLQARILEWVAFPFSRGSSQPRSPALQVDSLPAEPQGKLHEDKTQGKLIFLCTVIT